MRRDLRAAWVALAALLGVSTSGCGVFLGIEDLSGQSSEQGGWSNAYGATNRQEAWHIVGAGGTLFAIGAFNGSIDFGGGVLPSASNPQRFLAALDMASGAHRWSKAIGEVGAAPPSRLATSGTGVVVAGSFEGQLSFGDKLLTSLGVDMFVAKLDAAGKPAWSAQYGDAASQLAVDVATNAAGHVYLTGAFAGTLDIGGDSLTSAGNNDMFIAELDGTGTTPTTVGTDVFGDTSNEAGLAVALTPDGGLVVAGSHAAALTIGMTSLTAAGNFLAKLDSSGAPAWVLGFEDMHIAGLVVDATGDILIAGDFAGSINLGASLTSRGGRDVVLVKLAGDGTHSWSRQFGDSGSQQAWGLAVDDLGNAYLAGDFASTIDLGGAALQSAGGLDAFVAELDSLGNHVWSRRFGDLGNQTARGLAVDALGSVYVIGQFEEAIDLGQGTLESKSAEDLFLAKIPAGGAP